MPESSNDLPLEALEQHLIKKDGDLVGSFPAQTDVAQAIRAVSEEQIIVVNKKAEKLQKLAARRETGEIANADFDIYNWFQYQGNGSLTQKDLGNQAVVLSFEEFQDMHAFTILLPNGKECELDVDDFSEDDILIIYPEDLG